MSKSVPSNRGVNARKSDLLNGEKVLLVDYKATGVRYPSPKDWDRLRDSGDSGDKPDSMCLTETR